MKEQTFRNVWDAIEDTPAQAAIMTARSDLMIAVQNAVESWDVTKSKAAKRLKITQPRLNGLLRGRINEFELDALIELAYEAGLSVTVKIARKAA